MIGFVHWTRYCVGVSAVSSPEEIARVCVFLSCDDSSFMTGSEVLVDGGTHVVDANATWLSNAGLKWGGA